MPVDFVGKSPGWVTSNGVTDEVMSRDELRSLPELIELGSHSLSHPHLTRIDGTRAREEVTASRHQLAQLLDSEVSLLAFPYGEYDEQVVGACRQAGYERVFGIDPWPADPAGQDFVRGRVPVDPNDGPLLFHLKARGAYRWMGSRVCAEAPTGPVEEIAIAIEVKSVPGSSTDRRSRDSSKRCTNRRPVQDGVSVDLAVPG